jgi:hypothetical protein
MIENNTHSSANRRLEVLLKRAYRLMLTILSEVIFAVLVSAQSFAAVAEKGMRPGYGGR